MLGQASENLIQCRGICANHDDDPGSSVHSLPGKLYSAANKLSCRISVDSYSDFSYPLEKTMINYKKTERMS